MSLSELLKCDEINQSFSVQYTSVILIILTFIIGTYATRPKYPVVQPLEPTIRKYMDLTLLLGSEEVVDRGQLESVSFLLKNHDLSARIEVSSDRSDSDNLLTAQKIFRSLIEMGVPANAIQVFSINGPKNVSISLSGDGKL